MATKRHRVGRGVTGAKTRKKAHQAWKKKLRRLKSLKARVASENKQILKLQSESRTIEKKLRASQDRGWREVK
jgi:hypothetical protein